MGNNSDAFTVEQRQCLGIHVAEWQQIQVKPFNPLLYNLLIG